MSTVWKQPRSGWKMIYKTGIVHNGIKKIIFVYKCNFYFLFKLIHALSVHEIFNDKVWENCVIISRIIFADSYICTYYINDFTYKQLYIAVVTTTAAIDIILRYKLWENYTQICCHFHCSCLTLMCVDYYMAFFISYPLSAREPIDSRDDIWTKADKRYDMKNYQNV